MRKNCTNQQKIHKIDTCFGGGDTILWTKRCYGHLGVSDLGKHFRKHFLLALFSVRAIALRENGRQDRKSGIFFLTSRFQRLASTIRWCGGHKKFCLLFCFPALSQHKLNQPMGCCLLRLLQNTKPLGAPKYRLSPQYTPNPLPMPKLGGRFGYF